MQKTEKGEIEGIPGNIPQYTVFKGIPYAKAPVGELRWREPQETEKWEGVYHADHFGPIAPQMRHPKGSLYGDEFFQSAEDMSEDCLYLNIWTPEVKEEKNCRFCSGYMAADSQVDMDLNRSLTEKLFAKKA